MDRLSDVFIGDQLIEGPQVIRGIEQRGQHSLSAGSSRGAGPQPTPTSADWGLQSHCATVPENHWCFIAAPPASYLLRSVVHNLLGHGLLQQCAWGSWWGIGPNVIAE